MLCCRFLPKPNLGVLDRARDLAVKKRADVFPKTSNIHADLKYSQREFRGITTL